MAFTNFNGMTATYSDGNSTAVIEAAGITSFNYEGGDRAQIDVTTSASTRRESLAGFASERRLTLGLLLDDPTVSELDAMIADCAPGTLLINSKDCGQSAAQFLSLPVFCMGYSINGQIDGVLEVNIEFMVAE